MVSQCLEGYTLSSNPRLNPTLFIPTNQLLLPKSTPIRRNFIKLPNKKIQNLSIPTEINPNICTNGLFYTASTLCD